MTRTAKLTSGLIVSSVVSMALVGPSTPARAQSQSAQLAGHEEMKASQGWLSRLAGRRTSVLARGVRQTCCTARQPRRRPNDGVAASYLRATPTRWPAWTMAACRWGRHLPKDPSARLQTQGHGRQTGLTPTRLKSMR